MSLLRQLDPDVPKKFLKSYICSRNREDIILVEHKVDLLAEYADEIIVMGEGKILSQGP